MMLSQYQRGVVWMALRSFDFWYLTAAWLVANFVSLAGVIEPGGKPGEEGQRQQPIWWYVPALGVETFGALAIFGLDAMPDYRVKVAWVTAIILFLFIFLQQFLGVSNTRSAYFYNRDFHNGTTYKTSWGAVGVSAAGTVLAFVLRALLRAMWGKDFLLLQGAERLSRRHRQERAARTAAAEAGAGAATEAATPRVSSPTGDDTQEHPALLKV
jgi:hypothetical protein